jgi:hypothetical protein
VANSNFAAQVSKWVQQTKGRQEAVFRESAQRVIEVMQTPVGAGGNMPVDTGFLRASLRVQIGRVDSLPAISATGAAHSWDGGSVALVINGAKLGDMISAIYLANYARRINYGFVGQDSRGREYNQRGYLFVQKAGQQWQGIVRAVSAELKSRAK